MGDVALGACEASAEATERAGTQTKLALHSITPPPRFRSVNLALSGQARKFGFAQNDTAVVPQKLSPRGIKKGSALFVLPDEGR